MSELSKAIKNPYKIIGWLLSNISILRNNVPDEIYLKIKYRSMFGEKLDLENPETFNAKMQWLKLYDRKDIYTVMVDKLNAKKYVAEKIGDKYIVPTLGVWNDFDEIDFEKLPNQFVLKCTHDSGGLVICKDKKKFNKEQAKIKIEKCLKNNFYYNGREWPYKNVKPKIIAEQYLEDKEMGDLRDYKFFCFNGKPEFLYVSSGMENHATARLSFYDLQLNEMPFGRSDYKRFNEKIERPGNFDEMISIASQLSQNIPFLRVDLYSVDNQIYFSELTFYPNAGFIKFEPTEWDKKLGAMLSLPVKSYQGEGK